MQKPFVIFLATLLAYCARADTYLLDFGTKDSPLHPGAIRVTEAGGDRANWCLNWAKASANPITREWTEDKHSGKKSPPPVYLNDLTCDYVTCNAPLELNLKNVPPGAYKVVLLCGRAGGRPEQVWDIDVRSDTGQASATFAGGYELRALHLDAAADAKGLALVFGTRSRWLVNTLIAVPSDEWEVAQKSVIAPLLAECFTLPPEEMSKWKETPRPSPTPEPQWTERQKRDGLVAYARPWAEPVWPDHFPRQHELDAPVRAFASPGEYEPLTFTLYPLSPFSNVTVEVYGSLVCTSGVKQAAIDASDIDVRFVRYMNVRPNYSAFNTYYRAPDVLMPWKEQPLKKGENLRVWLTVKVPPGQPPGLYTGEADVLVVDDGHRLKVPLSLRVLPITLQKDQSLAYGQYYHHPLRNLDQAPDDFSRAWWQRKAEAEHADMREHGMNTVVLGLGGSFKDGKCVYQFDRLQRDIDLYRSVGFDKPVICSFPFNALYHKHLKADMGSHLRLVKMPPDAFFEELTAMVRAIESEARRRQWPELLYYPVDEPSTSPDSVAFMTRVMAAIKQVPKVRTYITADPEHEQFAPLRPFIDVWCCQPFSLGRAAILADMKARGVEYWCYPNHISGENDHTTTLGARMTYGFGFWQSGYRALIPWIYQYNCGDPWNYLDSSAQDFFNRTADDGAPIPVTLWEADREGIDDQRYLFTLENTIARAEEAGHKEAAAKARAVIDHINAAIQVQPKYKNDGLWSAETFDAWRWAVAEQIISLQALLN
jgi:hypothetical protein